MMQFGTQRLNGAGHLEIGGCDAVELARTFGTPLYVLDEALVREKCRAYRDNFTRLYPNTIVSYSAKALAIQAVCRIVESEGLHIDVASHGELHTALSAGCSPNHITCHGNYKSDAEIAAAMDAGVFRIVADSLPELHQLERLAGERGNRTPIQIRLNPGVKPHIHEYVQTGHLDSKFGLGIETGAAEEGVVTAHGLPHLNLKGIHCHIGSQIFDAECYHRAIDVMLDFALAMKEVHGITFEELNLGGGLGIRYTREDAPPSLDSFARTVVGALIEALDARDLGRPTLMLEPGRSIVGEAGTTLYTVGVVKHIQGVRTYVTVDGGLSDNPRPALYEAEYEAIVANKASEPPSVRVRVSGKHCETDTLISDITIQQPEPGDILAVFCTGAYNHSMASNYNRFPRPAVVLVNDARAEIVVERETLDDLITHDRVPARLAAEAPAEEREAASG
ncbi:MAG: diaminopimelate decarboxylase [Armatimonadota bacterium]